MDNKKEFSDWLLDLFWSNKPDAELASIVYEQFQSALRETAKESSRRTVTQCATTGHDYITLVADKEEAMGFSNMLKIDSENIVSKVVREMEVV